MKVLKKSLSMVLALVLLVSTFAVVAQAAELSVTKSNYGTMVLMNNKFTSTASTVKLYGKYDYINFYINSKSDGKYFFYEIYSDKNCTKLVTFDYVYCDYGSYTWSPMIKLKNTFKTGTYYCVTYSAKIDSKGNATVSAPSMKEFKISVDRTTAFNKQMVIVKPVKNTVNGPQIKWSNTISNVSKFIIYRRSLNGTKWKKAGTVNGKTFSFTDKSVKDKNCKYIYTVKAINPKDVCSRYHYAGTLALYARTPKLTASTSSNNRIKLSWDKTGSNVNYLLYRKTNDGNWKRIAKVTGTSYYDSAIKNNNTYQYTVRAQIGCSEGVATSSYYSGTNFKYIESPTLSDLTVTNDSITVSWGAVTGATNYAVYRKPADFSKSWTKLASVPQNTLSYTDETASDADSYIYTVRSEYGKTQGSYSSKGVEHVVMEPVKNVRYNFQKSSYSHFGYDMELLWNKHPYASYYSIYRMDENGEWKVVCDKTHGLSQIVCYKSGANTYAVQAVREYNGVIKKSELTESAIIETFAFEEFTTNAHPFTDYIYISWHKVSCATGYNVYRRLETEDEYTLISGNVQEIDYKDYTAEDDIMYEYQVRPVFGELEQNKNLISAKIGRTATPETDDLSIRFVIASHYPLDYSMISLYADNLPENATTYYKAYNGLYQSFKGNHQDHAMSYVPTEKALSTDFKFATTYSIDGFQTPLDTNTFTITARTPKEFDYAAKITKDNYTVTWDAEEDVVKYEIAVSENFDCNENKQILTTIIPDGSPQYSADIPTDIVLDNYYYHDIFLIIYYKNGMELRYIIHKKYISTPKMTYATRKSDTEVSIGWENCEYGDVSYYDIYRKVGDGSWSKISKFPYNSSEVYSYYVDKTASKGVAYTYAIKAVSTDGVSSALSNKKTCSKTVS